MLFADQYGGIYDHPTAGLLAAEGEEFYEVPSQDLIPLPDGAKLFFLPGSLAVGKDGKTRSPRTFKTYRGSDEPLAMQAMSAFLPPGYARTHLPAAAYGEKIDDQFLPLWAYAAVGWDESKGGYVTAAVRVDPMTHSDPENYDDRELVGLVEQRMAESPDNRLYAHIKRCALEYHCFAAKNAFYVRHEAPVPLSPACTARCVGCISLQEDPTCDASHERITFLPRVDEIVELATNHLVAVPDGIVSFGQGCEGEPLMQWKLIAESIRQIRRLTPNGSLHLNTNGYDPSAVETLARAGLDSIRVSLNSFRDDFYSPYYRPVTYQFDSVIESIRRAKELGVYTSINYLIFPGITDQQGEVDALMRAIDKTQLDLIQMKNLCIDPRMYLGILPPAEGEPRGIRHVLRRVQTETNTDLGYFNRPRSLWGQRFCESLEF